MVLLRESVESGATIVAIGPYTNLATLEAIRIGQPRPRARRADGRHRCARPRAGLPQWGPDMDWNVQCDTNAAQVVFANTTDLTLTTLAPTFKAHLRAAHLPRLRAAGPLGELLAQPSRGPRGRQRHDRPRPRARRAPRRPPELPVRRGRVRGRGRMDRRDHRGDPLTPVLDDGVLRFDPDERGRATKVVVDIDADDFTERWFEAVERAATHAALARTAG